MKRNHPTRREGWRATRSVSRHLGEEGELLGLAGDGGELDHDRGLRSGRLDEPRRGPGRGDDAQPALPVRQLARGAAVALRERERRGLRRLDRGLSEARVFQGFDGRFCPQGQVMS